MLVGFALPFRLHATEKGVDPKSPSGGIDAWRPTWGGPCPQLVDADITSVN